MSHPIDTDISLRAVFTCIDSMCLIAHTRNICHAFIPLDNVLPGPIIPSKRLFKLITLLLCASNTSSEILYYKSLTGKLSTRSHRGKRKSTQKALIKKERQLFRSSRRLRPIPFKYVHESRRGRWRAWRGQASPPQVRHDREVKRPGGARLPPATPSRHPPQAFLPF